MSDDGPFDKMIKSSPYTIVFGTLSPQTADCIGLTRRITRRNIDTAGQESVVLLERSVVGLKGLSDFVPEGRSECVGRTESD